MNVFFGKVSPIAGTANKDTHDRQMRETANSSC